MVPTPLTTSVHFAAVSVGASSLRLTSAGKAYCWGANESGQLGNAPPPLPRRPWR